MAVVDNVVYVDGRRSAEPDSLETTFDTLRAQPPGHSLAWIGLLRPDKTEVKAVAAEFGLHPLAVEDTIHFHQRPKLERYDDVLFVVLRPARYVDPVEVVEIGEIHLFLGPDFVITVRHADEPDLARVRQDLESRPELLAHGPHAVLHAVLDRVVDDYGPVLDGLENDVDEIEVQVFDGDAGASRRIYTLTREVIEFQRAVEPLAGLFDELRGRLKESATEADLELRRLLRDVADHATRALERTQSLRDLLANILQVNATLVAQRQNEEMAKMTQSGLDQNEQVKRISSWAAIAFAPTLVAGVYGMNFKAMPELDWGLGYPYALGLMAASALVLYLLFKRRGWL